MASFKFVISDGETKRSYQLEVDQSKAAGVVGKKIGEDFDADAIGLSGYTLKITGGTDRDGFPMHPKQEGPGKRRVLLLDAPGFHPKIKGQRKRKTVRGNTVSEDTAQINTKVVKKGPKTLEEITGKKPAEEKKPEAKAGEEKAEPAQKQEPKPEEKKEAPKEKVKDEKTAGKKETPKEEAKREETKPQPEKQEPVQETKTEEKKQ